MYQRLIDGGGPEEPLTANFTDFYFSSKGPYTVRIADRSVVIDDTSEVTFSEYQLLRLGQKIDFEFGYITKLVRDAKRGDKVIYVEPFEWWFDSLTVGLTFPSEFPLTVRGPEDTYNGIDLLYAKNYSTPSWTCDPNWYGRNDGCHCGCGSIDPDCVFPSAASFAGKVYDASDPICVSKPYLCPTCDYCEYPSTNPQCTATAPVDNTFVTFADTNFIQEIHLASPLVFDHVAGQKVETPVSLPADPADGFSAFTDPIFDVYSWIPIKHLTDTPEYPPSERYLPHTPELSISPDPLAVEVALFMVPDRNDFATVQLCPGNHRLPNEIKPIYTSNGWNKWTVDEELNIKGCHLGVVNSNQCYTTEQLRQEYPDQFNTKCIKDMPPSHTFSFTTRMPANNKWKWEGNGDSLLNMPEYLLDVNHIYRFNYDEAYSQVGRWWNLNWPFYLIGSDGLVLSLYHRLKMSSLWVPNPEVIWTAMGPFIAFLVSTSLPGFYKSQST